MSLKHLHALIRFKETNKKKQKVLVHDLSKLGG